MFGIEVGVEQFAAGTPGFGGGEGDQPAADALSSVLACNDRIE